MSDPNHGYRSALETRNASAAMRAIFSPQRRYSTWRRIWHALARAQMEMKLPVTQEQVAEIGAHLDDIDFARAEEHEARLRHDVMAHVHTLGDAAPRARPIIHLGATSQDVVCNADLLLMRDALQLIARKLAIVIDRLGTFSAKHRATATLGFTHYQPAQPTTVGKRATMWAQEFALSLSDIEVRLTELRLRGLKGATGTQASYLALFQGDSTRVAELEKRFVQHLGWDPSRLWLACGQTYPRAVDAQILSALAVAAAAVHKCATDIRLLANLKELEEPFEADQVGSSAMPYKRNPMRCERACGLARFVMALPASALATASTQWLERSLDDSSNRRLTIPESFLALDGALDVMANVLGGLVVYPRQIAARLESELPFMLTEEVLMDAVRLGADRQDAHSAIRKHSQESARIVKEQGGANDLVKRLQSDPIFAKIDISKLLVAAAHTGIAANQVDSFIREVVEPVRASYRAHLASETPVRI
ncbi:MAG: adenylosuccinate lyase [Phycisphaerales bacterium]|nr:adenylosuccinate lyase [Phycisphaerales bacterium]